MTGLSTEHLIIAPILIPFFAGAVMLLYEDRQRRAKLVISLGAALAMLVVSVELLTRAKTLGLAGGRDIGFYLLGDWAAPFGIVLVVDRLSAKMLVLTGLLALPALVYSAAGWHRQGQHFHALFQFLLMALGGRMILPLGGSDQILCLIERTATGFVETRFDAVRFVPLLPGVE